MLVRGTVLSVFLCASTAKRPVAPPHALERLQKCEASRCRELALTGSREASSKLSEKMVGYVQLRKSSQSHIDSSRGPHAERVRVTVPLTAVGRDHAVPVGARAIRIGRVQQHVVEDEQGSFPQGHVHLPLDGRGVNAGVEGYCLGVLLVRQLLAVAAPVSLCLFRVFTLG